MTVKLIFVALIGATLPAMAQVAPACGTGQACPAGSNQVPFPVINPAQGLANILALPQRNNQPPQDAQPAGSAAGLAPIATPPPVLPPATSR